MFHGDWWLDRQPRSGNIPGVAGASSTQLMLTGWRWFVHEVFTKNNALLDSLICWLICLLVGCWLNLFHLFYPKIMICLVVFSSPRWTVQNGYSWISQGDILMHLRSRILPILLLPTIQSKVFYSRDVQILNKAVPDSLRKNMFHSKPEPKSSSLSSVILHICLTLLLDPAKV